MPKLIQSKQSRLVSMLTKGAKINQLTKSLGWQPHTVRAAISRLRKSGSTIECTNVGGQSCYHLIQANSKEEVAS